MCPTCGALLNTAGDCPYRWDGSHNAEIFRNNNMDDKKAEVLPALTAAMDSIERFRQSLEELRRVMEIASKGIDRFNKVWKEKQ
jgi:hypothetical protein